jgi:CHRD domain
VFLCSNLGNGPAGTQACPPPPATITGTIRPADVIGPAGQGIDPMEFDELVRAIQAGVAYANVHSETFPNGEIRGQLRD